jgi:predicted PurR-regulated permease PerM
MTIKSQLNTIAVLSIGTVAVLLGFLFYTTVQISNQLDQIDRVNNFSQTASELNIITEQYLAYEEQRYLKTWNELFEKLKESENAITDFPTRNVVKIHFPQLNKPLT